MKIFLISILFFLFAQPLFACELYSTMSGGYDNPVCVTVDNLSAAACTGGSTDRYELVGWASTGMGGYVSYSQTRAYSATPVDFTGWFSSTTVAQIRVMCMNNDNSYDGWANINGAPDAYPTYSYTGINPEEVVCSSTPSTTDCVMANDTEVDNDLLYNFYVVWIYLFIGLGVITVVWNFFFKLSTKI